MKNCSNDFKTKIKTFGKQQEVKIIYVINEEETTLMSENINNIIFSYKGNILKSIMKELIIDSNVLIPMNTIINFQYGLKMGNSYEYINYGNFIVNKIEEQEDTNSYLLTCYDKMLYSMKSYEKLDVEYPITIRDYITALCNKIGLVFKNENDIFANYDKEIDNELYLTTEDEDLDYTYRDILDELAQATGSIICINEEDDELEIRYENKTGEQISESGKDLTITEHEDNKLLSIKLNGETNQATRSGKNKIRITLNDIKAKNTSGTWNNNVYTWNGVTFTVNNDLSITIGGTFNSRAYLYLTNGYTSIDKAIYKIYGCPTGGSSAKYAINADVKDGASYINTFADYGTGSVAYNMTSFTAPSVNMYIDIRATDAIGKTFYPMLLLSTETDTSYEPYGVMPSPEFPSPIENVEGINKFDLKDLASIDTNYSAYRNGYTFASKDAMYSTGVTLDKPLKLPISYSYIVKNGTGTNMRLRFWFDDGFVQSMSNYGSGTGTDEIKIEANNITKSGATAITKIGMDYSTTGTFSIRDFIINEGETAKPYVPYNTIQIKKCNKNLFDESILNQYKSSEDDEAYIFNNSSLYNKNLTPNIKFKENTAYFMTYIAKQTTGNPRLQFKYTDGSVQYIPSPIIPTTYAECQASSNPNKTLDYISSDFSSSGYNSFYIKKNSIQLEEGSTATEYIPHEEQTYNFPLAEGQKLYEGSYLEDDGIHNVKKQIVLTGNETIYIYAGGTYSFQINLNDKLYQNNAETTVLCNYLTGTNADNLYTKRNTAGNNLIAVGNYLTNYFLLVMINDYTTVNDIKNYLSTQYQAGTPVVAEVQLAEEEIIPYNTDQQEAWNEIKNMKLYDKINYIFSDASLDIKYIEEYETIDEEYLKDINVNFGEKYGPINSIVLSRAGESDNVYIRDEESVQENGLCEIKIIDNQIMNFNDRSDYLQDLLNKLNGLEFYINDFTSPGILYFDLFDKFNIKVRDNKYRCLMLNDEVDITQGIQELIHTNMPEESETDYKKSDKTDKRINQTYLIVDKQRQRIDGVINQIGDRTEKSTTITADIDGLETTVKNIGDINEQFEQFKVDINGAVNKIIENGGNNLFYYDTDFWTGSIDSSTQQEVLNLQEYSDTEFKNNTVSGIGYILGIGIANQDTAKTGMAVPNGTYTISFKYKKTDAPLSIVKVKINGEESTLTEYEWTTFSKTIEVTTNHIEIEFSSNVGRALYIADLMGNAGEDASIWTQNPNETRTETVKIGKGIEVSSSKTGTKLKADADGVRIVQVLDEKNVVAEFTDKGTETEELIVKGQSQISGLLFQQIGNQVWISNLL